jgi:hypothetical protein
MNTTDYAGDAYRACLHGDADPQQQRSAASQIALLHGVKGELLEALADVLRLLPESTRRGYRNIGGEVARVLGKADAAIDKALR